MIAVIEGLYIIVVPNKGVIYSKDKDIKNKFESKQRELQRLEENRISKRSKLILLFSVFKNFL